MTLKTSKTKIINAVRKKKALSQQKKKCKLRADFSTAKIEVSKQGHILKVLRLYNYQLSTVCAATLPFKKEGKMKVILDK